MKYATPDEIMTQANACVRYPDGRQQLLALMTDYLKTTASAPLEWVHEHYVTGVAEHLCQLLASLRADVDARDAA